MTTENDPTPNENPDIEAILSTPKGPIEVSYDKLNRVTWEYETHTLRIFVLRLRMIQLMKMLKIATSGLGGRLDLIDFDPEDIPASIGSLIAAMTLAIPDAIPETTDFVRSLVEFVPDETNFQPGNNKHAEAANAEIVAAQKVIFDEAMANPDPDFLLALVKRVITIEGPHLAALGKELMDLINSRRQAAS